MPGSIPLRVAASRDAPALSRPVVENRDWQVYAACRGLGTDLFFKSDDELRSRKHSRETEAKAVCATCSVLRTCLEWACG